MPHFALLKQLILVSSIAFITIACNSFDSNENGSLRCSVDTVFFDTILSGRKTTTKIIKIYNDAKHKTTLITKLLNNNDGYFYVNINGLSQNKYESFQLEPNDSIYVFVEMLSTESSKPNITANLEITSDIQTINIPFIAYVQDYTILSGFSPPNLELPNNKVYLIKDSFVVKTSDKLNIGENTKFIFDKKAYLKVYGNITAKGSLQKKVIFSGSRLDDDYFDVAGQWQGIFLEGSSSNNWFENCEFKNSTTGISIRGENSQTTFHNCIIQHNSYSNVLVNQSNLTLTNCVLGDCGAYSLKASGDSKLTILNTTIANYWSAMSGHGIRLTPSVLILTTSSSSAYFGNTIIFGNRSEGELSFDNLDQGTNTFEYSLFKVADSTSLLKRSSNCTFNPKFRFKHPYEPDYNYSLDTLSQAKDAGNINIIKKFAPFLDSDILGKSRTADKAPDMGAYERNK